uniref:Ankyrin repeat domain-containing protein n=1 Tax=Brassica oleracea TaxID=3712 RepID=A0A3P6FGL7_BRAOL|nr:unnamed protein product [Brassica oleracea]
MKQMIGSECLVDETTGLTAATTGNSGQTVAVGAANSLPPSSAVVRLDQMSGPVYTVPVPDMILDYMDFNDPMLALSSSIGQIGDFGLDLVWRFIHIVVTLCLIVSGIFELVESYAISLGLIQKYSSIDIEKLKCLAVVVDIEAARDVSKVIELLRWLTTIGVKQVGVFDSQGLLKKSKDMILEMVPRSVLLQETGENNISPDSIALEFISSFDNKEAVVKAANILLQKYLKSIHPENGEGENVFTESHLNEALRVVGECVHVPDLLLVYGPVRSHLGFPAWRLRYTEIVHMGSLKYMRYGSLLKAIHKFTGVRQNYGKVITLFIAGDKMAKSSPVKIPATSLEDYAHSPFHYAVVLGDHAGLTRLVSSLPKLTEPERIHTESDSASQERLAEQISAAIDRRDVPLRETPLHLAVRIGDVFAAETISSAGADITLQNAAGWSPLHEALCRRNAEITETVLRHQRRSAWCKWRRRLPHLIAVLRRMRDFYMEISFHFESSVIPFVGKIAPSDTYRIWKRGGDLRADTSLAGFDRFKIRRASQSFLFLGDGDEFLDVTSGTLLVLNREEKTILNAFENANDPISDGEIAGFCSRTSLYRPGMDVTKAELVEMTNWRRQAKTETIGEWRAKGYEVANVSFSFKSRKVRRQHGCSNVEEKEFQPSSSSRRSRKSVSLPAEGVPVAGSVPRIKEKEFVKSLSPSVWLTEDFPLKTEELLPLLDILANKVKAVRRMRELLTAKFPPGTFPVKLSIPVIPTVKVVVTFSKFVPLRPIDQFYTPLSSPRHLSAVVEDQCDVESEETSDIRTSTSSRSSFSTSSWRRLNITGTGKNAQRRLEEEQAQMVDPFSIATGYKWTSNSDNSGNELNYLLHCLHSHISTYLAHSTSFLSSLPRRAPRIRGST